MNRKEKKGFQLYTLHKIFHTNLITNVENICNTRGVNRNFMHKYRFRNSWKLDPQTIIRTWKDNTQVKVIAPHNLNVGTRWKWIQTTETTLTAYSGNSVRMLSPWCNHTLTVKDARDVEMFTKKNVIKQSTVIYITVGTAAYTLADKMFFLGTEQHQLSLKNYSKFLMCVFCEHVILQCPTQVLR